jgi:zinc D-Ala-D-Ala dipeptidase
VSKGVTKLVLLALLVMAALLVSAADATHSALDTAGQLLVVVTPDWTATTGTLRRYERVGNDWKPVGSPIPVAVGRKGMGWGLGLQASPIDSDSPVKQEGDGRSPAGVFPIGAAFGYDADKPSWLKLPYLPLTSATECVDDRQSLYYNAVVDRVPTQAPGWSSSEKMRQVEQYRWGVIVDQNAAKASGGGSCIFLHIWTGPAHPTAGCTAMAQSDLEEVMRWLDGSAHPMLVELPVPEYARLRDTWHLPAF